MDTITAQIEDVVDLILEDYGRGRDIDRMDFFCRPDKEVVIDMVEKLWRIVYPGSSLDKRFRIYNAKHNLSMLIEDVMFNLNRQISIALQGDARFAGMTMEQIGSEAQQISLAFFNAIPKVRALAQTDVQAGYDGDPAACSKDEVIYSYPGLFAITVQRLAHELHILGVPLLPRIMTEHAHSVTGIDIHPGATIGSYFFIDHGTGVVIGETTTIGDHVRIYQGVTLGSLTTRGGQSLRGSKRHPTIGDNVTIYAGASILGGDTVIGSGSVVGSNAFIISSIGPNTAVRSKAQELQLRCRQENTEY